MVTYQTSIGSLSLLGKFQPLSAFVQDLVFFQVKMATNYCLESLRRVLYVLQHSKFHVSVTNDVCVCLVLLLTLRSALLVLKTWLVKVNIFTHYNRLD